tara:strand:- start:2863 stop:4191 length:1329 start_codon:yes stop_codon:yes gene_type:complete
MTSRFIEIRPDNIPSDGVISFKNGFPVLSFTISAQDGLLDPRSVRVVGEFNAYKDNLATPTPLTDGDNLTMNNRLGIYNVFESLTIRSVKSKMICENIRHYSKYLNTYLGMTSSLQDQMGHLAETCLIMPNAETFRKSVMENASTDQAQTNSFSMHIPSGFMMGGNLLNLRPDAFGGIQIEFQLQPDANVLYATTGSTTGLTEAHYELSNLKLTCEVQDIPEGTISGDQSEGVFEFNTITSLYTSINSTNAQIQYNLALHNVLSAFMTFMPVSNINTLTADGQATTFPSGKGSSDTDLAFFKRIQFLKGGSKFPADFDFVNDIITNASASLPDPQIVKNFVEAVHPTYGAGRMSISPVNANREYNMITALAQSSYTNIAEGGALTGLGVKYGIGGQGEDFSQEQFGVSIESELDRDHPIGVYIFIKAKAQLVYNQNGIQLLQ